MFGKKLVKPNDVFTPRAARVNENMYVNRKDLETKLARAVDSTQHLIIFGDSGSGKTWLYNQFFQKNNIAFRRVDLSVAASDSLEHAFSEARQNRDEWIPEEKTESAESGLNAVIKAGEGRETVYRREHSSAFENLVADFSSKSPASKFLVLDNLEQVATNDSVIQEIASYIIRLDNPRFSEYNIRFLLVGVIADMRELVARYDQAGTVANRITELPEVEKLKVGEAEEIIVRGFVERLQYEVPDRRYLIDSIMEWTERNAQQVHSLGYQIACEARDRGNIVSIDAIASGKDQWIEESLAQHMSMVENRLNKNDARWQRRNQVLYCLGRSLSSELKAPEIEAAVKTEFPHTVETGALRVDQVMAALSKDENPLLIRDPLERSYRFSHPKIKLAINALLSKDVDGDVMRVD